MLDALGGEGAAMTDWMINGGGVALQSWGGDPEAPRATWPAAVPAEHMRFLHALGLMHREGGYLFVHAGIRPGVAITEQTRQDLISIRQAFLYSEADFGVVVVHGHTPKTDPVCRQAIRIGDNDTGAVYGGRLTCAVLEADRVGFIRKNEERVECNGIPRGHRDHWCAAKRRPRQKYPARLVQRRSRPAPGTLRATSATGTTSSAPYRRSPPCAARIAAADSPVVTATPTSSTCWLPECSTMHSSRGTPTAASRPTSSRNLAKNCPTTSTAPGPRQNHRRCPPAATATRRAFRYTAPAGRRPNTHPIRPHDHAAHRERPHPQQRK